MDSFNAFRHLRTFIKSPFPRTFKSSKHATISFVVRGLFLNLVLSFYLLMLTLVIHLVPFAEINLVSLRQHCHGIVSINKLSHRAFLKHKCNPIFVAFPLFTLALSRNQLNFPSSFTYIRIGIWQLGLLFRRF